MRSHRKSSLVDSSIQENHARIDHQPSSDRRSRRFSVSGTPWMNRIRPFIYGPKNDDVPDCYNRVRYIRDSCKVLADLWKTDKEFLNKSIDNEVSKAFKEFRLTDVARSYRSPYGTNGASSILNQTIDDIVQIHDYIDTKRKEWLDQLKTIVEKAKDKQSTIRQTMTDLRDSYEKAQRRLEAADANLKKYQTRGDRLSIPNFEDRVRELEDTRTECEQARTLARDIYATETYKFASEEHSIATNIFSQYLFEQKTFYDDVSKFLSIRIPEIENRIDNDDLAPAFGSDLAKHCSQRSDSSIAYPIEICTRLLQNSLREEGLFRIAPSHGKQKKLVTELDLQSIDRGATLGELGYDAHVAASTLKQYLRELPDCILTSALLPQWNQISSISNESARLQRIAQLLSQLPEVNYNNLCYLVRFLARVAEYSAENKMTPSNLGICIGCSILYGKEQSMSHTSISNSYTAGSTILELMIIHHKQLFPDGSQQEPTSKSFKSQPDLIPTEFHPKSQSGSNENLLEVQNLSVYSQPSPGTRRKNKAPRPPASSVMFPQTASEPVLNQTIPSESLINEQPVNQNSTVGNSSSFSPSDKVHRRTPSDGIQLDRPSAPPPLPPPAVVVVSSPVVQPRSRLTFPLAKNNPEQGSCIQPEEKPIDDDQSVDTAPMPTLPTQIVTTPTNDTVNVGKLISELNNRMAAAKSNNTQINNIRASSIRNSTLPSPGETTDF